MVHFHRPLDSGWDWNFAKPSYWSTLVTIIQSQTRKSTLFTLQLKVWSTDRKELIMQYQSVISFRWLRRCLRCWLREFQRLTRISPTNSKTRKSNKMISRKSWSKKNNSKKSQIKELVGQEISKSSFNDKMINREQSIKKNLKIRNKEN